METAHVTYFSTACSTSDATSVGKTGHIRDHEETRESQGCKLFQNYEYARRKFYGALNSEETFKPVGLLSSMTKPHSEEIKAKLIFHERNRPPK